MGPVTIGADVGKKVDPTALAVAEVDWRPRVGELGEDAHYVIRHLERLPLGTPYHPDVANRIAAVVASIRAQPAAETLATITLVVDATGVGGPVIDLLREPLRGQPVRLIAATFNHGDRLVWEKGEVKVGKAWLVSRLQALLQSRRIHLPDTAEARALAQELLDYEIRIDEDADAKYGAFKVGTHDDLVTALGLAVQAEPAVSVAPVGIPRPSRWDPTSRPPDRPWGRWT